MPFNASGDRQRRNPRPRNARSEEIKVPKVDRIPTWANPLIAKADVGKARLPVCSLPGSEFVYGRKNEQKKEENINVSHAHAKGPSAHPVLDYVSMNRCATKNGVTSAKEIREYRKDHPHRIKVGNYTKISMKGSKTKLPSDENPNFSYGKPIRPSTPVACLMSDMYVNQWLEEQRIRSEDRAKAEREKQRKPKMMSNMLQPKRAPKKKPVMETHPEQLFKMTKFTKIGPKVVTHRVVYDAHTVLEDEEGVDLIHGHNQLPITHNGAATTTVTVS